MRKRSWMGRLILPLIGVLSALGSVGLPRVGAADPDVARSAASVPWVSFTRQHGLASDSILTVLPTASRYIWVGTNTGLSILSPTNDWLTLSSGNGLAGDIITDLGADPRQASRRWVATTEGATLLDDHGQPHTPARHSTISYTLADGLVDKSISAVAVDHAGAVWLGTARLDSNGNESGSGISVLSPGALPFTKDDDSWRSYTVGDGSLTSNVIHDIAVDPRGAVWVATPGGLDVFYDSQRTTYTTADGMPSNNVREILPAGDLLWLATSNGLAVLSGAATPHTKADDQWAAFTTGNSGLAANAAKSVSRDSSGRIWVGTNWLDQGGDYGAGVSVLDLAGTPFDPADDTWAVFRASHGLANDAVRSVRLLGALAFIGTRAGLSRLDLRGTLTEHTDDRWITFSERNRIAGSMITAIAPAGATQVWFGTDRGLSLLDHRGTFDRRWDDHWTTLTISNQLPSNTIRALAADTRGWLWIGTDSGLSVRDLAGTPADPADDVVRAYGVGAGQLASAQINDIAIDSAGRAWVACGSFFDGALHVLDLGPALSDTGDDQIGRFTEADGLPDSYVRAVALQGQQVWVATSKGAARLDAAATPFTSADDAWTRFTTENSGIGQDLVRDVTVDGAGNVWFALAIAGVSVFDTGGRWTRFTLDDGMISNAARTLLADRRGQIWIGTSGGISLLQTNGTLTNKADDGWANANAQDLPHDSTNSFALDATGRVWAGFFGGASANGAFVRLNLPLLRR